MWVKRWDMSENFCFFGQATQRSGMELSDVTGAMFWVWVCPEAISTAGQSLETKSRAGNARPGTRPETNALNQLEVDIDDVTRETEREMPLYPGTASECRWPRVMVESCGRTTVMEPAVAPCSRAGKRFMGMYDRTNGDREE